VIVDAHSHLDAFSDEELPAVLDDARAAGIELIVTVGMDSATSARGVAIADAQEMVYAAVGLHPWMAQDHPDGAPLDELEALAADPKVVAIGEIGLDHVNNLWLDLSYEDPELRAHQGVVFREQLRLAKRLGLPVILHSRGAHPAITKILREEGMETVGGLIQFQDGTAQDVQDYLDVNFHFTIGASVTYPEGAEAWHEVVRTIPDEAVCLETDAPWLPYHGREPARSAPSDLRPIGEIVAGVRGSQADGFFSLTSANALRALPGVRVA
jgi:TatD DNase family protein